MTKIMQQTNTETSHEDEQKNCHEDKQSQQSLWYKNFNGIFNFSTSVIL